MKWYDLIPVIVLGMVIGICIRLYLFNRDSTVWIGPPVVSEWGDAGDGVYRDIEKDNKSDPNYEIGFRPDGVVVWRKVPIKK